MLRHKYKYQELPVTRKLIKTEIVYIVKSSQVNVFSQKKKITHKITNMTQYN